MPNRTEVVLRPLIKSAMNGLEATITDDAHLGGAGCDTKRRRPDLLYERCDEGGLNHRVVIIEIDEHSHVDRESSCEAAKVCDESVAIKRLRGDDVRVFVLRLNPDEYDGNGGSGGSRVLLDKRIEVVCKRALLLLESGWIDYTSLAPVVCFYFYHSKSSKHYNYLLERADAAIVEVC